MIVLRDYQNAAVASILDAWGKHRRSTLLVAATGVGKSTIFSEICRLRRPAGMVLVVAHREELIAQAAARIEQQTGLTVAVEKAEQRAQLFGLWSPPDVIVASVQTLAQPRRLDRLAPAAFATVIVDECFVAGTMIGTRRIEDVRAGDYVPAWDERSGRMVRGLVMGAMRRKPSSLVRVTTCSGAVLTCTPEHPFATPDGWLPAAQLTRGAMVLSTMHVHLQGLPAAVRAGFVSPEGASPEGQAALLGGVREGIAQAFSVGDHGPDQPDTREQAHDGAQPDEASRRAGACVDLAPGDGMDASGEGGQWDGTDHAADASRERARLADGGGGCDGGAGGGLPDGLQAGHRVGASQDRDRGGRDVAPGPRPPSAGREEGCFPAVDWVDRVEVLEPGSDGTFGGMCADGHVYNLTVHGVHTYVANGLVVHNCHHATSPTYRAILDAFPGAKVLGVTATPDRLDRVGLHHVFESTAFEYDIRTAIADGWLCPIRQRRIVVDSLDLSRVRTTRGDLSEGDLQAAMLTDSVLHEVAGPLVREAGDRPTIVFTPGVAFAHALVEVLAAHTRANAAAIDGKTDPATRREILDAYARREVQYVVNCQVLTEGFDAPATSCIAVCRPTKSRALYAQMLGRGTRIAEGKEDLLALDFRDNSLRHSLVGPIDVLAGDGVPPELRARLDDARDTEGYTEDLLAAAEEAQADLERKRQEEEEARQRRARVTAQVRYAAEDVDPFVSFREPAPSGHGYRATQKQLSALEKFGVTVNPEWSVGDAGKLLDGLFDRSRKGLASWKQARWLVRNGYSPDLTRAEASKLMDAWRENGWRRPAA